MTSAVRTIFLTILAAVPLVCAPAFAQKEPVPRKARLEPAMLDQSIQLGRAYLLNCQRPDGSFIYEMDAQRGTDLGTRNAVREMGGLWCLAVMHRIRPTPETSAAIVKSLKLQDRWAKRTATGGRYLTEPAAREWTTNVVAIHVLTLLDFLAADDELDPALRTKLERDLKDEVKFLLSLRLRSGKFYSSYHCADGRGLGTPSPYADGEVLLALARAAKEDETDTILRQAVLESASVMYGEYVKLALKASPDHKDAVAFYPWGSAAFYELYTSGWPDTKPYAPRTIAMARWMTDVQPLLKNEVATNTGFAYEGLAMAWELARLTNDKKNQDHIGAAIAQGLGKLMTWQVGSHVASPSAVPKTFLKSAKSRGGIVHQPADPKLRIDTAQHQLNATMLVRWFMFRPADETAAGGR